MSATAIIYAYFETPQTIFNLNFYSKVGITNSETEFYVIVINGHICSVDLPIYPNVVVLERDNIGFDFGGHYHALEWLNQNKLSFDYYIFINAGVVGPFLPTYYPKSIHWSNIFTSKIKNNIKLVGTTINCAPQSDTNRLSGPKISGYFFATDQIGLDILLKSGLIFKNHETKWKAIQAEFEMTTLIVESGYSIDCLLYRYENVDWTNEKNYKMYAGSFPDRAGSYDGISIHPFEVVFHKWYWSHYPNNLVFFDYCKKYADWKINSMLSEKITANMPFYPVVLYERNNITTNLYTQLFSLINSIMECFFKKHKYIIIDSFLYCLVNDDTCPISKIINLDEITKNINQLNFLSDIKLFDRSTFELKIRKATYGFGITKTIDVTNYLNNLETSRTASSGVLNSIELKNKSMNDFFGTDPCPGTKKYLKVEYILNNYLVNDTFEENYENFVNNFDQKYILGKLFENAQSNFGYDMINHNLFTMLLQKIRFADNFYFILDVLKQIYALDNIVVLDSKLDSDTIKYYANQNQMPLEIFEKKLYEKYTDMLNKYTSKTDRIYILSYDELYIINKLGNHNFIKTNFEMKNELLLKYCGSIGTELSSIIDLLIGTNYSKIFIGCYSFEFRRGSLLSCTIAMSTNCKKVLIDLGNINSKEEVYRI